MTEFAAEYHQDFQDYLNAVSRRKVSLLVTAGVVFAISVLVALLLPPSYRSTATIPVSYTHLTLPTKRIV